MADQATDFPVLLLGPESCGKSLLLKSLQYFYSNDGQIWEFGAIPKHGRPTVGSDMANFTLPLVVGDTKKRAATKRRETIAVTIRELGGQMAPLWPTYFDAEQCRALIYCIDSLNPFQASRSAVELARILKNAKFREVVKGILIIFTKSADFEADSTSESSQDSPMSVMELRNMIMLDDILAGIRTNGIEVGINSKCSAVTGVGLKDIFAWMEKVARL